MRENDLSGEDGVVVGHVRIWESRTVLEFDLQAFSEILQPDTVNVGVLLQSLIPRLLQARPTSSFVTRFENVITLTPSSCLTKRLSGQKPAIRLKPIVSSSFYF